MDTRSKALSRTAETSNSTSAYLPYQKTSYLTSPDSCSIQSLIRSYLINVNGQVVERPQFLFMRIAVAIHKTNIAAVIETYEALSNRLYTHASPTLFNAGTQNKKFASCFLYQPNVDKPTALQFLATAHELDKMWLDDGGIGMSLCTIPSRRWAIY